MCGRFAQYSSLSALKKTLTIDSVTCDVTSSYNIVPTQEVLTVIHHDGNRLGKLRWGLVPHWAKDVSGASKMINARAETVSEKPAFRRAFKHRRCIIPADGFYEWKREKKAKQPWYFTLPYQTPFVFAGLWETWKENDEQAYNSCTIITTEASESIRTIHHRMPVILTPEAVESWLDPLLQDSKEINDILLNGHVSEIKGFPVSEHVNSARNNDPSCIQPNKE